MTSLAAKTLLGFPAVDPDSDFDDEPTRPMNPLPEPTPQRATDRPSADNLAALVEATRVDPPWLGEPRFAIDPESGRLVLAAAYLARQRDEKGNTFLVECPAGVELPPPATLAQARAIRTSLVAAALRSAVTARVLPHTASVELLIPLDEQWRREIVTAFREGDAGVRARG